MGWGYAGRNRILKKWLKKRSQFGSKIYLWLVEMRIIAVKTLKHYWEEYPDAEGSLLSWHDEVLEADWNTPNDMKQQFGNASIIDGKRVVFNIHGNRFRLIVDIEFKFKIVFVVWFGTHKQYDNVDAKTVKYVKAD